MSIFNSFDKVNTIICKVTKACNLRCKYCPNDPDDLHTKEKMSIETLINGAEYIFKNSKSNSIVWTFHGGEPLVMSVSWYKEALEILLSTSNKYGHKIKFSMQTNLTLLNNDYKSLIDQYGVSVGISLDGPPEINDLSRDKGRLTIENYKKYNLKTSPLIVLNNFSKYKIDEICNFLIEEKFQTSIINPCYNIGKNAKNELAISGTDFFNSIKIVIHHMLNSNGTFRENQISKKIVNYFSFNQKPIYHCDTLFCSSSRHILCLMQNGDLYPCGRFSYFESKKHLIGNINTPQNITKSKVEKIRDRIFTKGLEIEQCFFCKARNICFFGCPAFSNPEGEKGIIDQSNCEYTLLLYDYFKENEKELKTFYEKYLNKDHNSRNNHNRSINTGSFSEKNNNCSMSLL